MKIDSKAVHCGDRKRSGAHVPVTTPIYTASSYFYASAEKLDRVFSKEEDGFAYARYDNPTNAALEELVASLENGAGSLACASGMAAIQLALSAAIADRRKSIVAADALYGASTNMLLTMFEPSGVDVRLVDVCNLKAVEQAVAEAKPGCILMETVSNPLLRVGDIEAIASLARSVGAALVVDNTFATPMIARPLEKGANMVVHSLTKYLAGHGDVLGGAVVCDEEHYELIRRMSRICGPVLGPFESYLTIRGIKTFPLRFERQCRNACRVATWLSQHPRVERVNYLADPAHPDASVIRRELTDDLYGAIVSFEVRGAGRDQIFAIMDRLKMIVPATSLGDVHTMILYPVMSSHRDIAPKQRERIGIRDNLLRLSVGIEAIEDILSDLDQALGK